MEDLCAHIPCTKSQIFIGAALKQLIAYSQKLFFVCDQNVWIVVSHISADIPHIVMHDTIVIWIVVVCLYNDFTSLIIIAFPMLSIECNSLIDLSLNFLFIVVHKLVKRYPEEKCQWL